MLRMVRRLDCYHYRMVQRSNWYVSLFSLDVCMEVFVAGGRYLFTSESVSSGHPDKMADQISDGVLDALLREHPKSRVACETLVTTGLALLSGEITSEAKDVDYVNLTRNIIREIGYVDDAMGFNGDTCDVKIFLDPQSQDIGNAVDDNPEEGKSTGAGDQGLMFGFACNETEEFMPLPIALAHRIVNRLTEVRQQGEAPWLWPDGKSQVTVQYQNRRPEKIHTVVVSNQHSPEVTQDAIQAFVLKEVVAPVLPRELYDDSCKYLVNPSGRFVKGGPHADTGLTGRKIIVDTYGGWGRHGGGAFSGKDPTKVDRSAAYMARHIAKNLVAAGVADACEIQLSYAIGVAEPISVHVEMAGESPLDPSEVTTLVRDHFPLTPEGMIDYLDLWRPIYQKTAVGGHFGRSEPDFTWESIHRADELRRACTR